MTDTTYNGWTNYETWAVKLWIDNEQHSYHYWRETAAEYLENPDSYLGNDLFSEEENATYRLSLLLKEEYEEAMPEVEGVWADLLGAALSEVNWHEIASHMIADAKEALERA